MAGYVDEKVAKVTLDNKGFSKNADDTVSALEKMKKAFSAVNGKDATRNIASDMSEMTDTISKSTTKSEGLLSRLKGIFNRSAQGIDMSGAGQSIDRMNTDVASKTATTSSILSRLKGIFQKADNHQGFPNSIKSIDGLNSKVSGFDASPLSNAFSKAASSVQSSLSVMDIALGNVLGGMMQKAISFGGQFFRGPTDGLAEYNNKLGSIQTIMTNTEWEIPDSSVRMRKVSGALETLNDYADKTIYSFADMTRNIGTFTAAGVSLDKSATAIQGISNLAAASGSNTQQASTAMYQLSQALAAGKVGLQDWNSVVNAGMGGKLFQDRLTQTAEKLGHARDMTKSFRESLHDGWLTSEVLLETLREFSEDQSMLDAATKVKSFGQLVDTVQEAIGSGWSTTWEYFLGGFEEAKDLWTSIGDIVNPFINDEQGKYYDSVLEITRSLGNYRNAMLKTWKDLGGQQSLFNSIKNSFEIVFGAMTKFREGFRSVIGDYKQSAQTFFEFTKAIENVTTSLKNNTYLFATINSIGKLVGQTFVTLGWAFKTVFSGMKSVGDASGSILMPLRTAADSIARFVESIRSSESAHLIFYHIGKTIANVFNIIVTLGRIVVFVIKDIFRGFSKFGDSKGLVSFATTLSDVTGKVLTFVRAIEKFVLSSNKFEQIGAAISKVLSAIGSAFAGIFSKLKTLANPFGNAEAIFNGASNIFSKAGDKLANIISNMGSAISSAWSSLAEIIKSGYSALKNAFIDFDVSSIIKALIGLFAFDKWLKFKNSNNSIVELVFGKIKEMFGGAKEQGASIIDEVKGVFTSLQGTLNSFSQSVKIGSLLMIAIALGILALSIDRLSKIDMKDLSKGILSMGFAMAGLMKMLKVLTSVNSIPAGAATTLIAFAIAIRIMASAMVKLAEIPADQLQTATGGIIVVIYSLVKAMKAMDQVKGTEASMGKLIAFSIAVRILVMSVKALANIDIERLVPAMAATELLIYSLVKVAQKTQDVSISMRTMFGLITFALAVRVLVMSVKALAKLDIEKMVPAVAATELLMWGLVKAAQSLKDVQIKMSAMFGLIAFAGAVRLLVNSVSILAQLDILSMLASSAAVTTLLISLAAATKVIEGVKVNMSAMMALFTFAGSVYIIVKAMENISHLSLAEIAVSLVVVETIMVSLVGLVHLMKNAKVNLGSAIALITLGGSVYLIVKAMEPLAAMPLLSIVKALTSVYAIMGGLILAAHFMNKTKLNLQSMTSLLLLTGMLVVITNSLSQLSGVNWASMLAAAAGISAVIISMGVTIKLLNKSADDIKEVIGLRLVFDSYGTLLYNIGNTLTSIGAIPWPQIAIALGAVLLTIGAMVLVLKVIKKIEPNTAALGALGTMSASMWSIGQSLSMVAQHPWQSILAATGAIVATLAALAAVGAILNKFGSLRGAAQLVILGVGLMAIAAPIALLSTLNLVAVGASLLALAGNLTVLLVAAKLAEGVSVGLGLLSGTLITFGVSAILASASILIAGLGFLAFTMAIKQLVSIAPDAFRKIVDSFMVLVTSIAQNAPTIVRAIVDTISAMIDGLIVLIPKFAELGVKLLIGLLKGIKENIPELITTTVEMLVEMSKSLMDNIDILVQTGLELAVKLIESLATGLTNVKDKLIPALTQLGQVMLDTILTVLDNLVGPLIAKVVEILQPVGDAIIAFLRDLATAIEPVFTPLMSALKALFESLPGIIQPIADLIIAVVTSIADVIRSIADVIDSVLTAISNIVETVGQTIQVFIQGFVDSLNAIANIISSTGEAIKSALQGVGTVVESVGTSIKTALEGVGTVVESVGTAIKTALEGVGQIFESIGNAIKTALEGVADIIRSVGDAAKSFGEGFKLFGEGVKLVGEHATSAATGLASLTVEVAKLGAAAYTGNLQGFTEDIKNLATVCTTLGQSASGLVTITVAFAQMSTSLSMISASIPTVTTSFDSLSTSLTTISGTITPVSSAFIALVLPIQQLQQSLTIVATAFMAFASQIVVVGTALQAVTVAFTSIQNAITMLGTSMQLLPVLFDTLNTSIMNVQNTLMTFGTSLTTSATGFQQLGEAAMVGMMAMNNAVIVGMTTVQATMLTSITLLAAAVSAGFVQVSDSVNMSMNMVNATVAQSMQGVMSVIQSSMQSVAAQMSSSLSQVMSTVSSTMTQLSANIMSSMHQVNATITSSTAQMTATFTQFSSTAQSIVTSMMSALNSSFQSGMQSAISTVSSGMNSIISTISGYSGAAQSAGYNVGWYISAGIANGIWANVGSIESAAQRIIDKANEAARAAADIRSPSRLFAKSVGKYIPQGVAMGIDKEMPKTVTQMSRTFRDGFDEVASNAVKQGENMANAVSTAVNSVSDMLDVAMDDMSYAPVITPVIDSSNIDKFKPNSIGLSSELIGSTPKPMYSGALSKSQQNTVFNNDNSSKEYSIHVTVDNGGAPVNPKELAKEIQQRIKQLDDEDRRAKGEEVFW